jgi:hypothetical protein
MLDKILSLSKQLKLISFVTLAIFISSCAPQQRETSIGPSIDVKKPVQVALLLPKVTSKNAGFVNELRKRNTYGGWRFEKMFKFI